MKTRKRFSFLMALVGAWVLLATVVYGQEGGRPPTPPVEQALVPEGVFAVQLVEALKMGPAENEAQAESMLSAIGIEPQNGWIAGYPVTPLVLGEIQKEVAAAADAGKVGMGREEAMKAFGDLQTQLGLSVTPGSAGSSVSRPARTGKGGQTVIYKYIKKNGVVYYTDNYESIPKEYRDQVEVIRGLARPQTSGDLSDGRRGVEVTEVGDPGPPPEEINNYYTSEGPPVVTYYPPPEPYYYLYSWVPYPFWCSGFFFSGFFILHDFHRHVFFHRHPFIVTNHVIRGGGNRVFVVDPVHRTLRDRVASGAGSRTDFRSGAVRASARNIVAGSENRMAPARVSTGPRRGDGGSSTFQRIPQGSMRGAPGVSVERGRAPGREFGPSRVNEGRTFQPPSVRETPHGSTQLRPSRLPSSSSQIRVPDGPPTGSIGSFGGGRGGEGFRERGGSWGGGFRGHR